MTREEILALQAQQQALSSAPKPVNPRGINPDFHAAMVSAGAAPYAPPAQPPAPQPVMAPPMAPPMVPPTGGAVLPPIGASIQQLPQQAPVMSQVSPAPKSPAVANINNNVAMPMPTFTPAQQRPPLPTFQPQGLSPNLGNYGPPPSMPGYGMPRQGQPFKPMFGGLPNNQPLWSGQSTQPVAQQEDPLAAANRIMRDINLFGRYQ